MPKAPAKDLLEAARTQPLTLTEMQTWVDHFIGQFEEGYWHPLSMMARISEEVGELAREINHQFGEKPKRADEKEGSLALEIGDILFILTCLANAQKIDLEETFRAVMLKYQVRDGDRWTRKSGVDRL